MRREGKRNFKAMEGNPICAIIVDIKKMEDLEKKRPKNCFYSVFEHLTNLCESSTSLRPSSIGMVGIFLASTISRRNRNQKWVVIWEVEDRIKGNRRKVRTVPCINPSIWFCTVWVFMCTHPWVGLEEKFFSSEIVLAPYSSSQSVSQLQDQPLSMCMVVVRK